MKKSLIISVFNCMFYICLIRSSTDDLSTLEDLRIFEDELFFSFDKENFDNLKCNISEKTLNHKSLSKPPFGYHEPLGNFINTFCLIYQHSHVKHDKNFNDILKSLFDLFCEGIDDSNGTQLTFEMYIKEQEEQIKKILDEKNTLHQLVKVEEKEGRIICKINDIYEKESSELVIYNLLTISGQINFFISKFYKFFNILFLEGSLEPSYFSSLEKLNADYVKAKIELYSLPENNLYSELIRYYNELDQLLREKYDYLGILSEENYCDKLCKEYLKNDFNLDCYQFTRRNLQTKASESINFLQGKVTAKILQDVKHNLDAFCVYPRLYTESVFVIKEHVKKFFEGTNLSDKSLLNLAVQCFEFGFKYY